MMRILVVEDSPTQAQQLQLILEAEQFAVDLAANAEIALQLFADHAFDMIISDIMMPGLSGYELCDRIKKDFVCSSRIVGDSLLLLPFQILQQRLNRLGEKNRKPLDVSDLLSRCGK